MKFTLPTKLTNPSSIPPTGLYSSLFSAAIAVGLFSSTALAGNHGTNFGLTLGPASGGLGGTGYVRPQDTFASVFGNPATLMQLRGNTDFMFGASYIRVEPTNSHDGSVVPAFNDISTEFNNFIVPTVAFRQRINEDWVVGGGVTVISGLASDFRQAPLSPVVSYIVFGANASVAYKVTDKLTVGVTGQLGFGLLEFGLTSNTSLEQDPSVRAIFGATYDAGPVMFGASYATKLNQTFREVTATDIGPNGAPIFSDIDIDQPSELEIGFATTDAFSENWFFELDFIHQNYSGADAHKDLWVDQNILAAGLQYTTGDWKFRAGYNYHFDLRRDDVSDVTSLGGLSTILAPVGPGGAPAPVPVSEGLVQLVQATLAQPFWNHQVSTGIGYQVNKNIRLDMSATLAFGDEEPFGGNTLSDLWEAHAQVGITWTF